MPIFLSAILTRRIGISAPIVTIIRRQDTKDPYNDYQRMQRQSDYVRRQEENLSGIIIGISSNSSSHVVICVNTGAKKVLSVPCFLETGVNLYLQGRNPLGISSFFIHVLV